MSGGSWDYVFGRFDDVAARLKDDKNPRRRALGRLVEKIAVAVHDCEWVDSGDCGPGDEDAAIDKALGKNAKALIAFELLDEAKQTVKRLEEQIKALEAAK